MQIFFARATAMRSPRFEAIRQGPGVHGRFRRVRRRAGPTSLREALNDGSFSALLFIVIIFGPTLTGARSGQVLGFWLAAPRISHAKTAAAAYRVGHLALA